jgi:hypothetical protein
VRSHFDARKCPDAKTWVLEATKSEDRRPSHPLWRNAPSADDMLDERLRRIRFLRKYGKREPRATMVAERLERCVSGNRCLSGACPECARLFQRWFVRRSKTLISKWEGNPEHELVAISVVPSSPNVPPGSLNGFSIKNLQRRLKSALGRTAVQFAIGGIDISLNEDRDGKFRPFWSLHHYLITSTSDKGRIKSKLRELFTATDKVPRPINISSFENKSRRRSYALKMIFHRRIGHDEIKKNKNGTLRKCRNTSGDRLKAKERLELFIYLDQIGLAARVIFCGVRPIITAKGVFIK